MHKSKTIIKRSQITYENKPAESSSPILVDHPIQIELKVSREKLRQELSVVKDEMIAQVEEIRLGLIEERQEFHQQKDEFESTQRHQIEEIETKREQTFKAAFDEGHRQGFDQGFSEGKIEGNKAGKTEFDLIKDEYIQSTNLLFETIKSLDDYKRVIFEKTESVFIPLIEKIVKKVVSDHLVLHPEIIQDIVLDSIKHLKEYYSVSIRASSAHYDFLTSSKESLANLLSVKTIDIIRDDSLADGGCRIETDFGLVDASIELKMLGVMELINSIYERRVSGENSTLDIPQKLNDIEKTELPVQGMVEKDDDLLFTAETDDILSIDDNELMEDTLGFLDDDDDEFGSDNDIDDDLFDSLGSITDES